VDAYWLRLYKLTRLLMVAEVEEETFGNMVYLFHGDQDVAIPSQLFIEEIYDEDLPMVELQEYIVDHTSLVRASKL
jgi:ribulose-5-phosphate 4-epimerase/fuculose-1-phosphate aldolase